MKYNEDTILHLIKDYIKSTYGEHYSTTEEGFQNRLDAKKKQIADAETQTALSEYGQQFSQGQSIVNIIKNNLNNKNNMITEIDKFTKDLKKGLKE